ncbi:hypothetical protein H0H92_013208 [Tricholoma furcatifolium]|nr:hypothetical protein H0H92_013208 [Tricholoma furcatifolium]
MLTLGVNSTCDICLETFATGSKAASAIFCGHVFCRGCIQNLRTAPPTPNHPDADYKPCPLCRSTFDTRQSIRLHVDLDANASQPTQSRTVSAADREAFTLLDKMVTLANDSSSEVDLRDGLKTVMTFAQQHQQSTHFCALYACSRLLTYVIDVRAKDQRDVADKTMLEAQLTRLREEKETVERRAREDREMALSIETSLRDHAKSAQEGYESMIKHYNKVVDDMRNICHSLQYRDDSRSRSSNQPSTRDIASHINEHLTSYHDAHVRRDEHVVTDPENLLVSPLSTLSALPSQPLVLPDEAPVEQPPRKQKRRPRSSTCHNRDHPAGCTCAVDYTEPSRTTHRSSAAIYDRPPEREPYAPDTPTGYGRDRKRQSSPRPSRKSKVARDHSPYSCDQPAARDPSPYGREQATTGDGSAYRREETTGCDRSPYARDVTMQSYNEDTRSARSAGSTRESRQQTIVNPSSRRDRSPYGRDQPRDRSPYGREQPSSLYSNDEERGSSRSTGSTSGPQRQGSMSLNQPRDRSPYGRDQPRERSPYGQTASLYSNDEEIGSSRSTGSASGPQRQGSMSLKNRSPTPRPPSPPLSQSFKISAALQDLLSDNVSTGSSSQFLTPLPSSHSSAPSMLHDSPTSVSDQLTPLVGHYTLPKPEPELIARRREAHQEPSREAQGDNTLSPATREEDHSRPTPATHNPSYVPIYNGPISSASGAVKAKERERAEKADREKRDEESTKRRAEREERRKAKRQEAGYGQADTSYQGYGVPLTTASSSSSSSRSRWPSDPLDAVDRSQPPPPYTSTASQRPSGSGSLSKATGSRYAEKYGQDNYYSNNGNYVAA